MNDYRWKAASSSTKKCQKKFIDCISSDAFVLLQVDDDYPDIFQIPNWVNNRRADQERMLNFETNFDPGNIPSGDQFLQDFSTKMLSG